MRPPLIRLILLALAFCAASAAILGPRDIAPDFTATAVVGDKFESVSLKQYLDAGKWIVLFFYPFDFTFVCPTEIMSFSEKAKEFTQKNVQVIGVSCDSHHVHLAWTRTPRAEGGLGNAVEFPLVADITKEISRAYGVLTTDPTVGYVGAPLRGVFIIDPTGKIRSVIVNDEQVGRSTEEIMRIVDGFQYAEAHAGEGCPANWKLGAQTIKADHDGSKEYFREWAKGSK
jgi:alkyl hydroperoxide reductase subunit AhpC